MEQTAEKVIDFPKKHQKKKRKYKKRRKLKKLTILQKIEDKADPWEIFNVTVAIILGDLIVEYFKAFLRVKGYL